jgi:hypothetical protein
MRKYWLMSFVLSVLMGVGVAYAADISTRTRKPALPKTYQTTSYEDYDDGWYETGSPISPYFVDNGDGTITDRTTNLMWVKQPELIIPGASVRADNQIQSAEGNYADSTAYAVADLVKDDGDTNNFYVCVSAHTSDGADVAADLVNNPDSWRQTVWTNSAANLTTPKTMVWSDSEGTPSAIGSCEGLDYAGHSDWRLPNLRELMSIADYEVDTPAINETYFPNTQYDDYWSGSTLADWVVYAWDVGFYGGGVGTNGKGNDGYVRPVRSCK